MTHRRILFISPSADIGGAEMSLLVLLNGLNASTYRRLLLMPEEGPLGDRAKAMGCEVIIAPFSPMSLERQLSASVANSLRSARQIPQLTRLLSEVEPDLIHINSYRVGVPFTLAARHLRIPTIWHIRDIPESKYKKTVLKWTTRLPDKVIAISHAVAASLGIERQRTAVVIYNGVEFTQYEEAPVGKFRAELNLSDNEVLLCTIGQLIPMKGQHLLLRSFAQLQDCGHLHLAIVGGKVASAWADERATEAYIASLHQFVQEHDLSARVTFTGFRSDIPTILQDCDLYVHAHTTREPFGRVLVEAMAAKKPVVAPRRGGIPEIVVDGETGILYEPPSSAALTDALKRALATKAQWPTMGESGYRRAKARFSAPQYVDAVSTLYEELLQRAQ